MSLKTRMKKNIAKLNSDKCHYYKPHIISIKSYQILNFLNTVTDFDEKVKNFFVKNKNSEDLNNDSLTQFTPYMVNRWLSFYDKNKTIFVNETLNKFCSLFEDKNEMYKLYNEL